MFAESALRLSCHLPFLDPCTMYMSTSTNVLAPQLPSPQITKQKGLRLVSGLGLLPLPPPLLLTPLHLPSWTIGPLSSTRVQEEKKYRSIREYILRIQNCGEIQSNSRGLRSTIGCSRVLGRALNFPDVTEPSRLKRNYTLEQIYMHIIRPMTGKLSN